MTNDASAIYVSLEFTPNPNTLKFVVNQQLIEFGGANFSNIEDAKKRSPLAYKLMEVEGISAVMIGKDFVTVTKSESGDWDAVHQTATEIIEAHVGAGEPILNEDAISEASTSSSVGNTETEKKIMEILDTEIRPAVAMDGGDITLEKYENGIVYLFLQGSCAGCPSATATLKQGVEVRLKEAIPEIKEVVSV